MRETWVGLQSGVDPRKYARLLRRAHDVAIRSGSAPSIVRGVIADSWERCTETGVDPEEPGAPLVIDPDGAAERWRNHPLSATTAILRSVLGDLLYEARHIVVVGDADGCLLWADGHPDVLRASDRIRFTPGHAWSERAAGTNAVGTALAADHAVQVFSAEHYRSEVHGWQCSGAPVHDPETGSKLGVIDVTGRYDTAHPHTLAMVELAARLVEEHLRSAMLERMSGALTATRTASAVRCTVSAPSTLCDPPFVGIVNRTVPALDSDMQVAAGYVVSKPIDPRPVTRWPRITPMQRIVP